MEVHFSPETESRLQQLASATGRTPAELIEETISGYLKDLEQIRAELDGRYDEIKSGRVKPIDGEAAFAALRHRYDDRSGS